VLLSSDDIRADQPKDYINRSLPDGYLDAFVEALATRIAKFEQVGDRETLPREFGKSLFNTMLPEDVDWKSSGVRTCRPAGRDRRSALGARVRI
jgi:hypothetical protein